MAKGITELIADFKELHPCAYKRIIDTAIDEFAEQLKEQVSIHFRYRGIIEEVDEYADYIDEIAEQMKKEV